MIHQYKLGGYNIVLDICSGSVHAVDDIAYDIISQFSENDRESIISALTEQYSSKKIAKKEYSSCSSWTFYL